MSEDAGWFGIKRGLSAWFSKLIPSVEHIRDDNVERLTRIAEGSRNRIALTQLLGTVDVTTGRTHKSPKWSIYENSGRFQNMYNGVYLEAQGKVAQTDPVTFSPVNQE